MTDLMANKMINKTINIMDYGFAPAMLHEGDGLSGVPARVTAVHKERYELVCEHGMTYGRLKTSIYYGNKNDGTDGAEKFPTTGDFVLILPNSSGDSLIIKTLQRKSCFSRRDPTPGRGEQVLAANFDYVFIMSSLNWDINPGRMDRYVTQSWQSRAIPVIILTKADLVNDIHDQAKVADDMEKRFEGIRVHIVSARMGYGIDGLSEYIKPRKTLVFLGSSGVGKSSLVNALAGEEIMGIKEIREDDSRGRHTTTHRQLIMLPCGAMIIDTPGLRELGMWDVTAGLEKSFGDVEQFLGKCRFADCAHKSEPGCAIKQAIAKGELPRERWDSYIRLKRQARYSGGKPV